jgi:hypothetical protein
MEAEVSTSDGRGGRGIRHGGEKIGKEERECVGRRRTKEGEELEDEGKEMMEGRRQQKDDQTHK